MMVNLKVNISKPISLGKNWRQKRINLPKNSFAKNEFFYANFNYFLTNSTTSPSGEPNVMVIFLSIKVPITSLVFSTVPISWDLKVTTFEKKRYHIGL